MQHQYQYPGEELALFENAFRWKKYFAEKILPYIKGSVLEVGAGIGATTKLLNNGNCSKWIMLEPDYNLYSRLYMQKDSFPSNSQIIHGSLSDLEAIAVDTILYIDVLEHIENDGQELLNSAKLLNVGGYLIVLAPAFNYLFSEFDKAIGHFRRYTAKDLKMLTPPGLSLLSIQYLDTLGFFASVANKVFLHQNYPTKKQIDFWDKLLVPLSKKLDPLFFHSFGKSILSIWQKESE